MKLTFISVECDGPAMAEAFKALGATLSGQAQPATTPEQPPVRALPAPRESRPKPEAHKAHKDDEQGQSRGKNSAAILAALRSGPKTMRQVLEYVQSHGHTVLTAPKTSASLNYLGHRGQLKRDGDLWRIA